MTKARSPNYPGLSLRKAMEFAEKIYAKNHTHKAAPVVVAAAMGYSSLNGKSMTAISAIKKYGLLEEIDKDLRITKDALTIIAEPKTSPERAKTINKVAFLPDLFAELKAEYGDNGPPNDEILRSYLLRRGFLMSTVDLPIRAYRETFELVTEVRGLYNANGQGNTSPLAQNEPNPDGQLQPDVGDFIQWESGGVLAFDKPRLVRAVQEHDGIQWVFVEGSESGIPMSEVTVERRASADSPLNGGGNGKHTQPPKLPETDASQLGATEREWLRGPLSKEVHYRIMVTGEIGPKEIGKLIKLLTAQQDILADDEDE
jgi:hypothetical protein